DLASGKPTLPLIRLLEALTGSEKQALIDEIEKRTSPQPKFRIRQMSELGIFVGVLQSINMELELAETALAGWRNSPSGAALFPLCDLLKAQVNELGPKHA